MVVVLMFGSGSGGGGGGRWLLVLSRLDGKVRLIVRVVVVEDGVGV